VSRFSLSGGARTPLVTGLTAPFFLNWADAAQTTLIVPQRDPVNSITSIVVATSTSTVIASGVPDMPSQPGVYYYPVHPRQLRI
jgi:hypothetical protein